MTYFKPAFCHSPHRRGRNVSSAAVSSSYRTSPSFASSVSDKEIPVVFEWY